MMNVLKKMLRPLAAQASVAPEISPVVVRELNDVQLKFVQWNAERLGISSEESLRRYESALAAFPTGHGGDEFRSFCDLSYQIYGVLHGDTEPELFEAYQFHGAMHLLRMLSYPNEQFSAEHEVIKRLQGREQATILDFGCGLAHKSRGIARCLQAEGIEARLLLADIPTARKEFLVWLCGDEGYEHQFFDCTRETPIPAFPGFDLIVATEFFEHVNNPVEYFDTFNKNLSPGGLLVTNVINHKAEFMHVHPRLDALRTHILASGYVELQDSTLYQKDCGSV